MNVLVTGGCGYIGSHIILKLLENNNKVFVIDNLSNSSPKSLDRIYDLTKKISFIKGDIRSRKDLELIFKNNHIDIVIHLAGLKSIKESIAHPKKYYDNNVNGTKNLIECMKKFQVFKLVFSSSATVYGYPKKLPIKEIDSEIKPLNPYGETKSIIEKILKDTYEGNDNWSIINLRYFNPIGAHASGAIGEHPIGLPNNLMPMLLDVAIRKKEFLNVFGDNYKTRDGTGIRDYIHIDDLASGHLAASKKIISHPGFWNINLGTGKGYSVLEIIKSFEKATSIKIPYKIEKKRPGDIESIYADPSYAKEILDWEARKSLDEMCKDSWNWKINNPEGYS